MSESPDTTNTLDELKAANPFPATGSVPQPVTSQPALFEEIIMHTYSELRAQPDGVIADGSSARVRWWQRRLFIPAMAAFMVLVGLGAIVGVGTLGGAPSAVANFTSASESAAAFDSGAVTLTMDLRQLDGEPGNATVVIDYRYDFDNYQIDLNYLGDIEGAEPVSNIKSRGIIYEQTGDDPSFSIVPDFGEGNLISQLGLNPKAITADALIPLVDSSEDFAEVTDDDAPEGERRYRGTITTLALGDMERDQLPAGLSLFSPDDLAGLPPTMMIEAVLQDNLFKTMIVEADGESPTGRTDFTFTTEYRDFGQPQNIVAPEEFEQPEMIGGLGFTPEEQAAFDHLIEVADELEARRPGLCANLAPAGEVSDMEQARVDMETYIQCFVDQSEPQMADAVRNNPGFAMFFEPTPARVVIESVADAKAVVEDILSRNPGLCEDLAPAPVDTTESGEPVHLFSAVDTYQACFTEAGEWQVIEALGWLYPVRRDG